MLITDKKNKPKTFSYQIEMAWCWADSKAVFIIVIKHLPFPAAGSSKAWKDQQTLSSVCSSEYKGASDQGPASL